MNLMATAFDTSVADLENELAVLIQNGSIKARIDSHKHVSATSLVSLCLPLLRQRG